MRWLWPRTGNFVLVRSALIIACLAPAGSSQRSKTFPRHAAVTPIQFYQHTISTKFGPWCFYSCIWIWTASPAGAGVCALLPCRLDTAAAQRQEDRATAVTKQTPCGWPCTFSAVGRLAKLVAGTRHSCRQLSLGCSLFAGRRQVQTAGSSLPTWQRSCL